ncbi:uncharacterized protein LY89DRAFT_45047 [Mollisia scopiformis]|uniref:Stc1 domain-containing protein n=1 Tax=Mollisia scopiformis TaxID=149040 RepID=A0A194XEU8_MOLSC|nr:uncharacterized protein LY89DRAFT_45047 [Mollisia scopiformis]KUJ18292.1 hypothetical protein LY89DRAFT_45047 [Mollisia scopiformis]
MAYDEPTSEKHRRVQLPKSFQCRLCKLFKEPGQFSNKEINTYTYKVAAGHTVNRTSAQLRCRQCSGGQLHELKCMGPCGKYLDLQSFSKSARTTGGSGWCQPCVLWKEAAQHDLTPQAPPQGDLAPDEDGDANFEPFPNNSNASYYSDPEAGDGSDYDDYPVARSVAPSVAATSSARPARSAASFSARPAAASYVQSSATAAPRPSAPLSSGPSAPPSVRSSAPASSTSHEPSITSSTAALSQMSLRTNGWTNQPVRTRAVNQPNVPASRTPAAAPHLRASPGNAPVTMPAVRKVSDMKTLSSVSNPYEGWATDNLSQSGASAVRPSATLPTVGANRPAPVTYNAWDAAGQLHVQQRFSSDTHSEAGSTITSTSAATISTVRPPPVINARNSNWAKPVGSRNLQTKYDARDHRDQPKPTQNDYDSDDDM